MQRKEKKEKKKKKKYDKGTKLSKRKEKFKVNSTKRIAQFTSGTMLSYSARDRRNKLKGTSNNFPTTHFAMAIRSYAYKRIRMFSFSAMHYRHK